MIDVKQEWAFSEVEHLEGIIARHEDQAFKVRGWMYAIVTAISYGFFTAKYPLFNDKISYGFVVFLIVCVFFLGELVHRSFVRMAINRVSEIEKKIRNGGVYDGPRITNSMRKKVVLENMWLELSNPSVFLHYVLVTVVFLVFLIFVNSPYLSVVR